MNLQDARCNNKDNVVCYLRHTGCINMVVYVLLFYIFKSISNNPQRRAFVNMVMTIWRKPGKYNDPLITSWLIQKYYALLNYLSKTSKPTLLLWHQKLYTLLTYVIYRAPVIPCIWIYWIKVDIWTGHACWGSFVKPAEKRRLEGLRRKWK